MILIEGILMVVHLLQKCGYFLLALSYHIGRVIILLLNEIFTWIRDFISIIVLIGEELYRFFYELNLSIDAVLLYVRSSTNCSMNCMMEGFSMFGRSIIQFFIGTKVHTRLLTTKLGLFIVELVTLMKGGLVLIADSFWWLITLLPRILWYIFIYAGDLLVFSVNGFLHFAIRTIHIIIDDIFRLSIGLALLFLILRNRYLFIRFLRYCLFKVQALFNTCVLQLRLCWNRARSQIHRRQVNNNATRQLPAATLRIRRSPLPRYSRTTSSSPSPKLSETQRCVVCRDQPKSVVLLPCKHLCLCEDCADYLVLPEAAGDTCPLCRARVERSMSVYI